MRKAKDENEQFRIEMERRLIAIGDPDQLENISEARWRELTSTKRVIEKSLSLFGQIVTNRLPPVEAELTELKRRINLLSTAKGEFESDVSEIQVSIPQLRGRDQQKAEQRVMVLRDAIRQIEKGLDMSGYSNPTLELWLRARGEHPRESANEVWTSQAYSCLRVLRERLEAVREEHTVLVRRLNRMKEEFEAIPA